ncbi:MAG TPA: hypothetical protein VHU19_09635 [Pyrinomonadaceae bacterium]|jgi:hypothetical protein|nr:hypothetical protein [Pyrinomonadaceae bacterium]
MFRRVCTLALALCPLALAATVRAQQPQVKQAKTPAKNSTAKAAESDPLAEMRRTTAISLVNTLADDARMFRDPLLRARVQARAADALWDTDRERARTLFRRAWDEAETADADADRRVAEERQRQTRQRGSFSIQMPPSLRTEVLRLAAKRDRALGEEFLAMLDESRKREAENAVTSGDRQPDAAPAGDQRRPDPLDTPPAIAKRLRLAIQLLQDGDAERALQFADPALGAVTTPALEFLTRLRQKNTQAADKRYATLVGRAAFDPSSDANTVSLLASYLFTPALYMTFTPDGGSSANSWGRDFPAPTDIAPQLRAAYFRTAASILLRPTPPPEQDRSSAGRVGWYMVIARLMPLFDQFAPDSSAPLHAKMLSLSPETPEELKQPNNAVTRGLVPDDPNHDRVQDALSRLDRAKTEDERDAVYVDAVFSALQKKDPRVEEFLDKIEDTDLRQRVRAYVDFQATQAAVNDKDVNEVLRLAHGNGLTSIQRAWALTEAARLLSKSDPYRAVALLDEALKEAKEHIDDASPERVSALVAVATQLVELDRPRAWDVMLQVVKASNAAKDYTGEDGRLSTSLQTKNMTLMTNNNAQSFDLNDIFAKLAREDLQRAVDLAHGFEGESPRAVATLAIARTALEKSEKKQERAASN